MRRGAGYAQSRGTERRRHNRELLVAIANMIPNNSKDSLGISLARSVVNTKHNKNEGVGANYEYVVHLQQQNRKFARAHALRERLGRLGVTTLYIEPGSRWERMAISRG